MGALTTPATWQPAWRRLFDTGELEHRAGKALRHLEDGDLRARLPVNRLALPNDLAGTEQVLRFLAEEISLDTYYNLMDQYFPAYRAGEYPELARARRAPEYRAALATAERLGLQRLDGVTQGGRLPATLPPEAGKIGFGGAIALRRDFNRRIFAPIFARTCTCLLITSRHRTAEPSRPLPR